MAEYLVDASVVIEYLLPGPYTPNAIAFFDQTTSVDVLRVPEFCLLECTNVLWKHARFKNVTTATARLLLEDLRNLKLRRTPMKSVLDVSLDIALRNQLAVYDASHIALAQHYDCPLISIDQPQLRAATGEGILVELLTNFQP